MTIIIDRRDTKSNKNTSNRNRFIKRYKQHLKDSLDKVMRDKSIKDAGKSIDVPVNHNIIERDIDFDEDTGEYERVISGNKDFVKGDKIDIDEDDDSQGTGGGDGEDNFLFTLTKEEFFDIYFYDMDLPDFIKESMLDTTKKQYRRAGFIKDGIPVRLDILKTMQMSIARRISSKESGKKPPFLDDIDLRYRHFINVPKPMLKAVIFFCMDVSGSMEEHHKLLSKKFFILFYLFLNKTYESVDVRFIRYHHHASDVTEHEFFYSRETGGTEVLEGLGLINKIIDEEYPTNIYNVYVAHTSDGDASSKDEEDIIPFLDNELIDKLQYYAYVQVQTPKAYEWFNNGWEKLFGVLKNSKHFGKKLNIETAIYEGDVFPVLHNLFKKRG